METSDAADVFGALGQETRLAVLRLLIEAGPNGLPAGDIAERVGMPPSTASFHLSALERAAAGLRCTTAVHICYGYGIQANIDWKGSLGAEWRQYEQTFPVLAASSIDQVSLECRNSRVPLRLLALLDGKDVLVGVIDVATNEVEKPEQVAEVIEDALAFVPAERLFPCTNCGMAPMSVDVAAAKLIALGQGAAMVRRRHGA